MTCHHVFYILSPLVAVLLIFLFLEMVCAYDYWFHYHMMLPEMQYLGFYNEENDL